MQPNANHVVAGLPSLKVPSSGTTTKVHGALHAVAGPLEELLGEAGHLDAAHGLVDAAEHL